MPLSSVDDRQRQPRCRSPRTLTHTSYARGLSALARADSCLRRVLLTLGPPPLWSRPPGFATLVYVILEQQVSLASARATFHRLGRTASPLTPQRFLELDSETLKTAGLSRQKTDYCRRLARALTSGVLNLTDLDPMGDDEARSALMTQKGIGRWSADIYLLHALLRPDVWPVTDLALAVGAQEVLGLGARPAPEELDAIGESWRPWRAVAARLLWHAYLSKRGGSGPGAM